MGLYEKLSTVQSELKVPKGQFNSFGKYKYRSCEDILEAVKPILKKHGASIVIADQIIQLESRFYVKATAAFIDTETGEKICSTASAREQEDKKGMDQSQITGTASSYARKYALNGLLLIDDTKDADTDEHHNQVEKSGHKNSVDPYMPTQDGKVSKVQMDFLKSELKRTGITQKTIITNYEVKSLNDLSEGQILDALRRLSKNEDKS